MSLEWDAAGEVPCDSAVDRQGVESRSIVLSTVTDKERWQPISVSTPYQHLVERLEWRLLLALLLALLPDSASLLKRDGFALCCFSQFLVYADSQVEGLVGHELLVLDFVLVAECQRVLAFVLADEIADDCQLSVLVLLIENVEFAQLKHWLLLRLLNLQGLTVQFSTQTFLDEADVGLGCILGFGSETFSNGIIAFSGVRISFLAIFAIIILTSKMV